MRMLVAFVVTCGLLPLLSCSENQKPSADDDTSSKQQKSTEPLAAQSPGDVHGNAQVANHGGGHSVARKRHENQHSSAGNAHRRHGSRRRHKSAHGKSAKGRHAVDNKKKIAIGDKVPDFEVTINGRKWKLSQLRKDAASTKDGVIVLTFWCSFCHSCRDVEHRLDKLAKQYKGKAAVIALDASAGETEKIVAEFAKKRGLTLPIALDPSGVTADIFGTRVTTTTIVIDSKGVLRYRGQFGHGEQTFAEDALKAVLAGQDVPVKETKHRG